MTRSVRKDIIISDRMKLWVIYLPKRKRFVGLIYTQAYHGCKYGLCKYSNAIKFSSKTQAKATLKYIIEHAEHYRKIKTKYLRRLRVRRVVRRSVTLSIG